MTHVRVKRKVNYFPLLDTLLMTCCFSRQISKKYEDLKRAMGLCLFSQAGDDDVLSSRGQISNPFSRHYLVDL